MARDHFRSGIKRRIRAQWRVTFILLLDKSAWKTIDQAYRGVFVIIGYSCFCGCVREIIYLALSIASSAWRGSEGIDPEGGSSPAARRQAV